MDKYEHAAALILEAAMAGLDGLDWIGEKRIDEVADGYNGIGAAWMPDDVRKKLTSWLHIFEPAALIHDMRYAESDGMRHAFYAANGEFLENCLRLATYHYPWWSWRRWRARAVSRMLFECVSGDGGWCAWCDAYKRRTGGEDADGLDNNPKNKEEK